MSDILKTFRPTKDGVELFVRATPKAKTNKLDGVLLTPEGKGYLKIHITDIAEDNQANKAIIAFLSKLFDLPKVAITLKSGATFRLKSFLLDGVSCDEIACVLENSLKTL